MHPGNVRERLDLGRDQPGRRPTVGRVVTPNAPQRPSWGAGSVGVLDRSSIPALQRAVGNAGVASLLAPAAQRLGPAEDELLPTTKKLGLDVLKPSAVLGATGGLSGAGNAVGQTRGGDFNALTGNTTGGAAGSTVLSGALLADSLMALNAGRRLREHGKKTNDPALVRLGERKMKTAGYGVAGGSLGTTTAGLKVGAAMGSTAVGLGAAVGGLGIAGGALLVGQGAHKIVGSARKLLTIDDVFLRTNKGEGWRGYIKGREKRKIAVNALKVAAGVLGIAAGALLIASNPVGWAIGIAGMVAGGVVALGKLGNKIRDSYRRRQAHNKLGPGVDRSKHEEVRSLANQVAAENSENAQQARDMRAALQTGSYEQAEQSNQAYLSDVPGTATVKASPADHLNHDSTDLLSVLNVTPEMAKAPAGQDLIERKLSVTEAA